jgi:hypothetical protein
MKSAECNFMFLPAAVLNAAHNASLTSAGWSKRFSWLLVSVMHVTRQVVSCQNTLLFSRIQGTSTGQ